MSPLTSTPKRSMPGGSSVEGATTRTRAPSALSRMMFERATREFRMSPQMVTTSRSIRPLLRRMVSASSNACVGCSWEPSPALMTEQSTLRASNSTAPEAWCRTTMRSGCIALSVTAVSIRVSPLRMDEVPTDIFMTSAPSRLPASSKEAWVRVETSKKRLIRVRPRSEVCFFSICRLRVTKCSARSRRPTISSCESPSIPNKCRWLRTNEGFWAMFIKGGSIGSARTSGKGALLPGGPALWMDFGLPTAKIPVKHGQFRKDISSGGSIGRPASADGVACCEYLVSAVAPGLRRARARAGRRVSAGPSSRHWCSWASARWSITWPRPAACRTRRRNPRTR